MDEREVDYGNMLDREQEEQDSDAVLSPVLSSAPRSR
jgi:hypothetical protein